MYKRQKKKKKARKNEKGEEKFRSKKSADEGIRGQRGGDWEGQKPRPNPYIFKHQNAGKTKKMGKKFGNTNSWDREKHPTTG